MSGRTNRTNPGQASTKASRTQRRAAPSSEACPAEINHDPPASEACFRARLSRPATPKNAAWMFVSLPPEASARLPSRSMVSVDGTLNGAPFQVTLEPDGEGGHWLKVNRKLSEAAGARAGEVVAVTLTPLGPDREPEPKVPADLRQALATAPARAREVWADITPIARRDFVAWITSAKQAATRARRVVTACDMLASGKRRPCCFDRSGRYGKSIKGPVAADDGP